MPSSSVSVLNRVGVGRRPPVADRAGGVELAALVVEAVHDLMADDRADRAIIDRRVRLRVEEGRLQDAGREHDLVLEAAVIGVHRRRAHRPFLAVDRLAEVAQLIIPLEGGAALDVAVEVVRPSSPASNSRGTCRDSRPSRPSWRAWRAPPAWSPAPSSCCPGCAGRGRLQIGDQLLHLRLGSAAGNSAAT